MSFHEFETAFERRYCPKKGECLIIPLPNCDAELEIVSEIYFKIPLHLSRLDRNSYKVRERYDDYHGNGWQFSTYSIAGYDHSELFWKTICGDLYCGGIASHSYGQFKINSKRHEKRIQHWINSRRGKKPDTVRTPLVRLAQKYGLGESIAIRGSGALTDGREDGAAAVLRNDRGGMK
jgi:hypothetical protein